ncbi:hypothetical protein HYY74_05160 [Candidatus Woesearchaeota archaeon]|nr:hypothetical protein [Candidatus Woesearchaeota archaeon]
MDWQQQRLVKKGVTKIRLSKKRGKVAVRAILLIAAAFQLFLAVKTLAVPAGCQFSTNCPSGNHTVLYVKNETSAGLIAEEVQEYEELTVYQLDIVRKQQAEIGELRKAAREMKNGE